MSTSQRPASAFSHPVPTFPQVPRHAVSHANGGSDRNPKTGRTSGRSAAPLRPGFACEEDRAERSLQTDGGRLVKGRAESPACPFEFSLRAVLRAPPLQVLDSFRIVEGAGGLWLGLPLPRASRAREG